MNDDLDSYLDAAPKRRNYDDLIQKHAQRTNLDPDLVRAVVSQESGGNPRAVSPKGAQGVMQLMPATAQRFGVRNSYDPDENIRGGTDYLRFLSDRYNGDRTKILAAYNAGEGAVDKYGGVPPYKETRNYVNAISSRLGQKKGDLDSYLDPVSGQIPPPQRQNRVNPPPLSPATTSPVGSRQPSVPNEMSLEQALAPLRQIDRAVKRSSRSSDFGGTGSGRKIASAPQAPAMSARTPSTWERIKEAVEPYVPGLSTLDTPFGVKTDPLRGAVSGVTLGYAGDPRQVSQEEKIVDPEAQQKADLAHQVGSFAPAIIPYAGAARALEAVPALNRATRLAQAAKTAATFGSVEAARQGVKAIRGQETDPKEIAVSTALGAAMGTIAGVSPSLKRQVIAFVAPTVAADIAKGTDTQTAIFNALTNLGFALHAGGGRAPSGLETRLTELQKEMGNREPQNEAQPNVAPQRETVEPRGRREAVLGTSNVAPRVESNDAVTTPRTGDIPAGRAAADPVNDREGVSATAPQEAAPELANAEPQRYFHSDFGEVTESPNQKRVGKNRIRIVKEDGSETVVRRSDLAGRGNQRMVPIKERPSIEDLRDTLKAKDEGIQDLGDVDAGVKPEVEKYLEPVKPVEQGEEAPTKPSVSEVPKPVETTEPEPPLRSKKAGERGAIDISPEKVEYEPATTPILKDVERATMGTENQRPSVGRIAQRTKSYVQRALISEFTPLRELESSLTGKDNVPVVNMARKFEQVAGAPAKAHADVIDFRQNVVDPIRKSADDFNSYLFLKRVEDRLSKDPERKRVSDWTTEKAQQGLDELKSKVGPEKYKALEQAGDVYQKEMDKALRLQVESGRMSEDLYKAIKDSNDFYAPFKVLRHIEDLDILKGTGRRVATTQELSKKITGIDKEDFQLGNILQASAEQIVRSRILAEKNLKMLELDKLADLDPKGDLIRRVEGDERPRQGYEFVRFLKNGEPVALEVEHKVADAVQGLNPKQTGLLARVAMKFGGILRTGATSANAAFQLRNLLFADLPRASLVSKYGVRGVKDLYQFPLDWTQSLMSSFKGNFNKPDQLYMDFLRSGAANSTIQRELTPEAFRPTLGIAKPGAKHLAKSVLDTVPKISNAIEETSKILGVKRGMRIENLEKMSPAERQAAMEKIATEVRNYSGSPDFARKGSETRDLNLLFMFFNARLQGVTSDLSRLAGRTGKREATAAWIRLGATIGLGTTILSLLNKQPGNKDDYDKIPDWEKQNYWMIPRDSYFKNEEGETVRDYWRIPKRELGQIFGNTVESAVNFAFQRDPKEAKRWATDLLENISPVNIQGKNLGERVESSFSSTNPAIKLPAEAIMNRDTFRHRDIVPEYMKKVKPSEQYRESTPKVYRKAGQAVNVSPLRLEHLTEGITGSAANQFATRPQTEGRSPLSRYPVTRTFTRSEQTAKDQTQSQAEEDLATKQLLRRRERDDALRKFRAGEITKDEFDRLQQEGRITQSDVKRLNKEAGMTPQEVSFTNLVPSQALDRYERMSESQREAVKEIMQRKANTLLTSTALTDEQKEQFKQRIEALGIQPDDGKKRKSFSTSTKGFKSRFSSYLN